MPSIASDPYLLQVGDLTDDGKHKVKAIDQIRYWSPIKPSTKTGIQNLTVSRSLSVADATDSEVLTPFDDAALEAWHTVGTDLRQVEVLRLPITNNDERPVQVMFTLAAAHLFNGIRPGTKIKQVFDPISAIDEDALGWSANEAVFDCTDASRPRDHGQPAVQSSSTRITLQPQETTTLEVARLVQVESYASGPTQEIGGFNWRLGVMAVSGDLL